MSRDRPSSEELARLLAVDWLPRSSHFDPWWVIENLMGPNALWLTEYLAQGMDLRAGMRVLDMGCGRALSSIFLAKEFGVEVWATDLWVQPGENAERIAVAGLEYQVFPIHAEAHALPFAPDFFDAAVSIDAFHYFGTDDLYLGYFARFIKPGGQIGIAVPGVTREIGADIPPHLSLYWEWDFCSFHSPEWWRIHWVKTGMVDVSSADWMPDGWKLWLKWLEVCEEVGGRSSPDEAAMLRADAGRYLGFARVVGQRRERPKYGK
ncbi:MAG TPA: methyltransferase domain-containing protein [Chloroflexota bacterium]